MSATSLTWRGRNILGPGDLPAVAVSLTGPNFTQTRTQARSVIGAGADVPELRMSLLEETGGLAASDPLGTATAAAQVLECPQGLGEVIAADGADAIADAPVLLACRIAAEGGQTQLDGVSYDALLYSVLDGLTDWAPERRPAVIDIKVQHDCLPQAYEQAHGLGISIVASFHDFGITPAGETLEEVLARMAHEGVDLTKITVWPTSAHDVARLLSMCARTTASAREHNGLGVLVAVISIGALGTVSRVVPTFGSVPTFTVIPDGRGQVRAPAPGQLPIQNVCRCLELLRI